ncbi:uncharacterized protein Hap1MRO34_019218 [Clarias gariepinus]
MANKGPRGSLRSLQNVGGRSQRLTVPNSTSHHESNRIGKRSECFVRFLAILLINMQVVNSQGLPEISDMFFEFSYIEGQTNNLREKRDVNADILQYIIIIEVNVSQAIFFDQIKSSLESFSPFQVDNTTEISSMNITTVCQQNYSEYQCNCADQYFWSFDNCIISPRCLTFKRRPPNGEPAAFPALSRPYLSFLLAAVQLFRKLGRCMAPVTEVQSGTRSPT